MTDHSHPDDQLCVHHGCLEYALEGDIYCYGHRHEEEEGRDLLDKPDTRP